MAKYTSFFLLLKPNTFRKYLKNFIYPSEKKQLSIDQRNEFWSGNYLSWDEALSQCTGYQDETILRKCFDSLLKVKKGVAVYERDSVLFDKKEYSIGLLSGLFYSALSHNGRLSVLDFGGSFGTSYFQNKDFFHKFQEIKWGVVEQNQFINLGKENFSDEILDFYLTINQCIESINPNVFFISSSLQYIPSPENLLKEINGLKIEYIIFDRTPFTNLENFLTIQNVPNEIYQASYPSWFFSLEWILEQLDNYKLIYEFPSYCDSDYVVNNVSVRWGGLMLELKK